jgi:hypothetical protein
MTSFFTTVLGDMKNECILSPTLLGGLKFPLSDVVHWPPFNKSLVLREDYFAMNLNTSISTKLY